MCFDPFQVSGVLSFTSVYMEEHASVVVALLCWPFVEQLQLERFNPAGVAAYGRVLDI